jgi:hypothetical protein
MSRLREALQKAEGYLLNAQIDLETGTKKATTIATLAGGLKMIRAALSEPDWLPIPKTVDTSKPPFDGRTYPTCRVGERGLNYCHYIADGEWVDQSGRTTVTHSTFLPPTHFFMLPEPPQVEP